MKTKRQMRALLATVFRVDVQELYRKISGRRK